MLTNEELDVVSVLIGDLKISTHLPNNLRADFAVVPASAFTDVVVEKSRTKRQLPFIAIMSSVQSGSSWAFSLCVKFRR